MSSQSFVECDDSDGSLIVLIGIDPRLSSFLTTHIVHLKEQNVMFQHPHPETVVRRWTECGIHISAVVRDPADAEQTLYGTAVRGSSADADLIRSVHPSPIPAGRSCSADVVSASTSVSNTSTWSLRRHAHRYWPSRHR